jgi:glycerol-3-phosphate acyltransferase PlsY
MMDFILFAISAYLLGSIPTAIWLGKAKYGIDVREHGSNNAGATNTFRVLGKKPGVVVLFIDILKGFIAVFLPFIFGIGEWGSNHLIEVQLVAALCAVSGHVLPIFANFRGGKGVATSLGVIVGVHPIAAGICVAVFLIVFVISKYVSLGAMIAACCFPILLAFYFKVDSVWLLSFSVLLSAVVVYGGKQNEPF